MKTPRVIITVKGENTLRITGDVVSFDCSENLKSGNLDLTPGYVEQNASIVFYDRDGAFRNLIKEKTVNFFHGSKVEIYVEEKDETPSGGIIGISQQLCSEITICSNHTYMIITLSFHNPIRHLLGTYILDHIEASGEESNVSIKCIDYSYTFKDISVPVSSVADRSVHQLFQYIFSSSLTGENFAYLDVETETRCDDTYVLNSYFLSKPVKEALNEVCNVALVNIVYKNGIFYIARSL